MVYHWFVGNYGASRRAIRCYLFVHTAQKRISTSIPDAKKNGVSNELIGLRLKPSRLCSEKEQDSNLCCPPRS